MRRTSFYGGLSESSTETKCEVEWEMRPGGMLVQKRCDKFDTAVPQTIRIKVAYGALRFEMSANSQATFGELKKLLLAETGLQPWEQRLLFRGKEKDNGDYLDMSGMKNRSKVVLVEDPSSRERRYIEMHKSAQIQSARQAISNVSTEVDKLAEQVSFIEKSVSMHKKVAEIHITTLIEMLMRQAIKLDNISSGEDASAKKSLESKRVQKCVETLDVLKVSNARIKAVEARTKWETFESPSLTTPQWEIFD